MDNPTFASISMRLGVGRSSTPTVSPRDSGVAAIVTTDSASGDVVRRKRIPIDAATSLLLVLLAVAVIRGVIYALLSPYLTGPDEEVHLEYVAYLATGGESGERGSEGSQPPFYYLLMTPVHWLTMDWSSAAQLMMLRLASLSLVMGLVLFVWLAARRLVPGNPVVPVIAAAFVALHPQLAYIGSSLNNDNVANLMAAVLVYLAIALLTGARRWVFALAPLALGGAVMSKGQILPMAALFALLLAGFALRGIRTARLWRPSVLISAGVALSVAGVLVLQAQLAPGGAWFAEKAQHMLSNLELLPEAMENWEDAWPKASSYLYSSFWAAFIGESVKPDPRWYLLPSAVLVLGAAGYLWRGGTWLVRRTPVSAGAVLPRLVLVAIIAVSLVLPFLSFLRYAAESDEASYLLSLQGRYLFVLLPPLALLAADGWGLLLRGRTWGAYVVVGVVAALVIFDVVAMTSLLNYYQWEPSRLPPG